MNPANWLIVHDQLPVTISEHLDRLAIAMNARWRMVDVPKRGFSSSIIYPIQIASDRYALRNWNWPIAARQELTTKLQFQQRLARAWAAESLQTSESSSECPIAIVLDSWANGHMIAEVEDVLWTLSIWRPGATVGWKQWLSASQLASVAQTIAKMHSISLSHQAIVQTSGGWQDRLDRLRRVAQVDLPPAISIAAERAAQCDSVIRKLRTGGYFDETIQWVHTQAKLALPSCWIVRDAHQENWLFENEVVSGVVDFGSARCDWPLWDVIRLLSSGTYSAEQRSTFIGNYLSCLDRDTSPYAAWVADSARSLTNEDFWQTLDYLQNLLSAMQWRTWSAEERAWSSTELERWEMLLQRLD